MPGFYNYLQSVMPLKRILIALSVGLLSLAIVLYSGLTSEFVRSGTVASRAFSAFSFTSLMCFILLMSCEEYAIFKTKRELEHLIDDAAFAETNEDFDREQYLREQEAESFRPMDFDELSSRR